MRKHTKIAATVLAAAVLAVGASITSYAATGWVEEDGVWYYYDKDGSRVADEWKKSGDYWYWLDGEENGAMAVDKLIEDDDDIYFVDSNGQMVGNNNRSGTGRGSRLYTLGEFIRTKFRKLHHAKPGYGLFFVLDICS